MTVTHRCPVGISDPGASRERPGTRLQLAEMLRIQLGRALLQHLRGEPDLAVLEMGAVDQADVARAMDVLAEAMAATWSQLERRAIYPIPLEHVVKRLHAVRARDRGVSVDFLHQAVRANSAGRPSVEELIRVHGPGSALYGAFDATAAVVRFAGQRWWRPPAEILTDLGLGDLGSTR